MMPVVIKKLVTLTLDDILKQDIILSVNRARAIVTFYDGQFKTPDDNIDDFLYFIMYDPIKHRVILVNRMALRKDVDNTADDISGYTITHQDSNDITWMPDSIVKLFSNDGGE